MAEAAGRVDEGQARFYGGECVFLQRAESGFRAHPVRALGQQSDRFDGVRALLGKPPQQLGLAGDVAAAGPGQARLAQGVELPVKVLGAGVGGSGAG